MAPDESSRFQMWFWPVPGDGEVVPDHPPAKLADGVGDGGLFDGLVLEDETEDFPELKQLLSQRHPPIVLKAAS